MPIKTLVLAGSLAFALAGTALAQTAAGGGSAEGNMNNPASVKSNSEKAMERPGAMVEPAGTAVAPGAASPSAPGSVTGGAATGTGSAPTAR